MRIIIQGENRIATDLAVNLSAEGVDIILVGQDEEVLEDLEERHEIRCIRGKCSDPGLFKVLAPKPDDTFITVNDSDELNLVSCKLLSDLGVERCMCRLRNHDLGETVAQKPEEFGIRHLFRPEQLVEEQLLYLIQHPGTFQYVSLHDGLVQVLGVKARRDGPLVGRKLEDLEKLIPEDVYVRVPTIYTSDGPVRATGDTVISEGDDVFFVVGKGDEDAVIKAVHGSSPDNRKVFIAGGGTVGMMLASELQEKHQVKLLEKSRERCSYLAEQLDDVIVLHGSSGDRELLDSEYIGEMDVFCAATNDDESNYLAALLAKKLGAQHVIALINETAYVDLVEGREIDTVLVPSQISLGALLGLARRDVHEARRLRRGAAEVLSIVVNGKAAGYLLGDLEMPEGASIGAVVRDGKMLKMFRDVLIQTGDYLIVFLADVNRLPELTRQIG